MYNTCVPTPFYHISVAEDLLSHPDLKENIRELLTGEIAAFFFGNTAPDVQVISGQRREETHFFQVPVEPGAITPWEQMILHYPSLANGRRLPPHQAAFIIGWMCHLQADWYWVKNIFTPIFGYHASWGDFASRLYLHNVLRSYLDFQIHQRMNGKISGFLRQAQPEMWLPFVKDEHLSFWRDYLVRQLQPDSKIETVEVFAARQGISTEAYYHLINSEQQMDLEVFSHIPRRVVENFYQELIEHNLGLIHRYLDLD